jgi:IS66 Orf2 like protein
VKDRLGSNVVCFCNRSRSRIKVLFWEGSELWVCSKRLKKGRFGWSSVQDESVWVRLSQEALTLILLSNRQACLGQLIYMMINLIPRVYVKLLSLDNKLSSLNPPIDVRRRMAEGCASSRIAAEIVPASVVGHKHDDVGFLCLLPCRGRRGLRVCSLYGPGHVRRVKAR